MLNLLGIYVLLHGAEIVVMITFAQSRIYDLYKLTKRREVRIASFAE